MLGIEPETVSGNVLSRTEPAKCHNTQELTETHQEFLKTWVATNAFIFVTFCKESVMPTRLLHMLG